MARIKEELGSEAPITPICTSGLIAAARRAERTYLECGCGTGKGGVSIDHLFYLKTYILYARMVMSITRINPPLKSPTNIPQSIISFGAAFLQVQIA